MLHILLLILKIIGIILAVILAILILLLGIILFVPIRYEVSAKCDGAIDSLKMKGKVTWLLHLLKADLFIKGKKLKWQIRAAWIKKSNAMTVAERKEAKNDETNETVAESREFEETSKGDKEEAETFTEEAKENQLEEEIKDISEEAENIPEEDETISEEDEKEPVRDKIQKISEKITKLIAFLEDKSHVNAFRKIKKWLFVLLRRLKPKKLQVKARFGFEDPCMTGQVLAGLSMLYPVFEDSMELIPDFEKKIFKGTVYLKGKIRLIHFASLALKLILSKDVRTSYKDIKNFKL